MRSPDQPAKAPASKKSGWQRWIIVAIVITAAVGAYAYMRSQGMPRVAWNALNDADRYELISLHPYLSKPDYHGHEILGRTIITDQSTRQRLIKALQSGARAGDREMAACFNPRHGIRVTHKGVTTEFVICFECRQVQVWRGGEKVEFFPTSDSPQPVFDDVLKAAGVPLAPRAP